MVKSALSLMFFLSIISGGFASPAWAISSAKLFRIIFNSTKLQCQVIADNTARCELTPGLKKRFFKTDWYMKSRGTFRPLRKATRNKMVVMVDFGRADAITVKARVSLHGSDLSGEKRVKIARFKIPSPAPTNTAIPESSPTASPPEATATPTPLPTMTPPTGERTLVGGWRLAEPFARGSIAIDWSTRRLWMSGHTQHNTIQEFILPEIGPGDDINQWPVVTPTRTIASFWDGGEGIAVYPNGLIFWKGKLWVAPRKFYDTAPPETLTLYSESGEKIVVPLPRQIFSGFVKRFGQDPLLGCGGTESGQGSARGPSLATMDGGTVYLYHDYSPEWEGREDRPANYFPVNHIDAWYALEPRNGKGKWASDSIYGGGLWLPEGVAYWPYLGTGVIDYVFQNVTLSLAPKTYRYLYDTSTWKPEWTEQNLGMIQGQDFGPNGEVVLAEGNAWTSGIYRVDTVVRVYR